jgi:hypothetical protein
MAQIRVAGAPSAVSANTDPQGVTRSADGGISFSADYRASHPDAEKELRQFFGTNPNLEKNLKALVNLWTPPVCTFVVPASLDPQQAQQTDAADDAPKPMTEPLPGATRNADGSVTFTAAYRKAFHYPHFELLKFFDKTPALEKQMHLLAQQWAQTDGGMDFVVPKDFTQARLTQSADVVEAPAHAKPANATSRAPMPPAPTERRAVNRGPVYSDAIRERNCKKVFGDSDDNHSQTRSLQTLLALFWGTRSDIAAIHPLKSIKINLGGGFVDGKFGPNSMKVAQAVSSYYGCPLDELMAKLLADETVRERATSLASVKSDS